VEEIRQGGVVVGMSFTNAPARRLPKRHAGMAFAGDNPAALVPSLRGVVTNLPAIEEAAAGQGHFNLIAEHDSIIRRVPLLLQKEGQIFPSLVAEVLRVRQGASSYQIKSTGASGELRFGGSSGITHIKIGGYVVPTDGLGRVWLYDSGTHAQRWIPAWKVLSGSPDTPALRDAVVFIGTSASGLKDFRATSLNPAAAGVEVHAQLAEQIMTGSYLYRPDWADGAELSLLVGLGILCVLVLPRVGAVWCALCGLSIFGAIFLAAWLAFAHWHWMLDPVMPALAVLFIYLLATLTSYIRTESERRQIKQAFGRYLSPELVNQLAENPGALHLGGQSKDMTVLFADIRGFTNLSERMDAQSLTRLLNRYMTPMTEAILQYRGTIDKYMGDGLMAFWNAPLDDPQHPEHAARAALTMRQRLCLLNAELEQDARLAPVLGGPLQFGVGLTRGECCVGNLGSEQRFDYSVVGDVVNLAARLEGQAKTYGVDIVIDATLQASLCDFAVLELDLLRVKGKQEAVRVYALLGDTALQRSDAFKHFQALHQRLLEAYRGQRWEEALAILRDIQAVAPSAGDSAVSLEKLYALYTNRIHHFQRTAPGTNWDGVAVAETK
jgi:adenylate cyclase